MNRLPITRALISVSDRTGLVEFARRLHGAGIEIVSSGGTASALSEADIPVTEVADITGAPEMLGGRVKTLHPDIHGGILADLGDEAHRSDLAERGIEPFGLVVVSLYPFESAVAAGAPDSEVLENIDIGGPTLIRAAAKNHAWVATVVSPDQYAEIADQIDEGGTTASTREGMAREAFFHTAQYEAAIVNWLEKDEADHLALALSKVSDARYGENPHQPAALYAAGVSKGWWAAADVVQGKAMSFNNYADADAAWRLANDLPNGSAAIVKHMNACGAATGELMHGAFRMAWACDPLSAFGGVVALNGQLDRETALEISQYFVEVVIARSISDEARAVLAPKENLRVLVAPAPSSHDLNVRTIDDGFLVQRRDSVHVGTEDWEAKSRQPTTDELHNLELAWVVAAHTKSNAIVVVNDGAAVGVGAGDQSRVGAAKRALAKAGKRSAGAVAASDGFFPFRDGVDTLALAGITAIVEPGGSIRDGEVVAAAQEHDVAIMFTHRRHFRH
ncbi:MAG: bifunctional phosphoribosylaminoimidazolecarboxamide formyltransferase/IMP cyclohydrolase [Acidimicrobiia bacterium]